MYQTQTTPTSSLYLEGLAVSVGYGDFLETTLQRNLDHFDNFVVVTSYDDAATQAVCARHGVTCVQDGPPSRRRRGLQQGPLDQPRPGPSAASRLDRAPGRRHRHARPRPLGARQEPARRRLHLRRGPAGSHRPPGLAAAANEPAFPAAVSLQVPGRRPRLAAGRAALAQRVRLLPHRLFPALARQTCRAALSRQPGLGRTQRRALRSAMARARRLLLPGMFVYHLQSEPAPMGANWQGRKTKAW